MSSKSRKPNSAGNSQTKRTDVAEPLARKSKNANLSVPAQSTRSSKANKQDRCLDLLAHRDGADLSELVAATDWQQHSVRGFLSGVVKKKFGLTLHVSSDEDGIRRYRIDRNGRGRG